MKKYVRYLTALLLVFLICPANVLADDLASSQENWVAYGSDHKMTDNFEANGITDEARNDLQPGDTMTFKVDLRNTSGETTAWYMRNEVLQTLEEQQPVAEGGAYTYVLTYSGPGGTKVLYDSEAVGGSGENPTGGLTGLEQATVALDDESYIYLDDLPPGTEAQMTLKIGLDGETQGNDYQDTLARVELGFAVEPASPVPTTTETHRNVVKTPKTGDTFPVLLFSCLTLVSGLVCVILVCLRLKRKDESTGKEGGPGNV